MANLFILQSINFLIEILSSPEFETSGKFFSYPCWSQSHISTLSLIAFWTHCWLDNTHCIVYDSWSHQLAATPNLEPFKNIFFPNKFYRLIPLQIERIKHTVSLNRIDFGSLSCSWFERAADLKIFIVLLVNLIGQMLSFLSKILLIEMSRCRFISIRSKFWN